MLDKRDTANLLRCAVCRSEWEAEKPANPRTLCDCGARGGVRTLRVARVTHGPGVWNRPLLPVLARALDAELAARGV